MENIFLNAIQNIWLRHLSKIADLTIYGKDNVPNNTNFILAANHDGYFDAEFLLYAFKGYNIHFFYHIPDDFGKYFLRWWYRGKGLGVSYNRPDSKKVNHTALSNAVFYLKKGWNLGIMPQGIRTEKYVESSKRHFYPGCAIISCKSGKPVIPVRILNHETYIYNSEVHISPMGVVRITLQKIKSNAQNGKPVILLIGEPIYPDLRKYDANKREYISELTEIIKEKVFELEEKFNKGEFYV